VRNIVSVLVEVGLGKRKASDMVQLLAMKNRALLKTRPAPAGGLYLVDVHY
jgi:tRNA U38,U39,U40 pseudouridine synthase TruA